MNDRNSRFSGAHGWRRTALLGLTAAALSLSGVSSWAHTEIKVRSGALASIVTGDCQVQIKGKGAWKKLGAKGVIQPGDVVKTGKKARLELTFSDGTRLRINENSSVVLVKDVTKVVPKVPKIPSPTGLLPALGLGSPDQAQAPVAQLPAVLTGVTNTVTNTVDKLLGG